MPKAFLEYNGDTATLHLHTYLDTYHDILVTKEGHQSYRLGGTACDSPLECHECTSVGEDGTFTTSLFQSKGKLSCPNDQAKYALEFYDLDMEGKPPGWLLVKEPVSGINQIFINVDLLDGGGNIVKRYRISPFTGDYRIMDGEN